MIAHINGQVVNYCALAASLGVSSVTVKSYIDLLESTYMVETVSPYFSNLGKRLVKSLKVYMADSGITATLLELRSFEQM
jgi:predicted AAA+ superfamily ATPase